MRFALLEAKLAIVKALRVVEIQRCEKTQVSRSFSILIYEFHLLIVDSTKTQQIENIGSKRRYLAMCNSSIAIKTIFTLSIVGSFAEFTYIQ